jgi:hypothetical protein
MPFLGLFPLTKPAKTPIKPCDFPRVHAINNRLWQAFSPVEAGEAVFSPAYLSRFFDVPPVALRGWERIPFGKNFPGKRKSGGTT